MEYLRQNFPFAPPVLSRVGRTFFGENSERSSTNLPTNQNFENTYTANNNTYTANNTANNINEASENNSDAEQCVSTESKVSKAKQDRWNIQQTGVLVNMWKDHYKELESIKQHSIWILIKIKIDAAGKSKILKQIKTKIRNLKDAYKTCKDNSKKTGRSPTFYPYFQDFEEILRTWDIVNFPHARKAGVTNQENVGQATENKGKCYLTTVKFSMQVPPQIRPFPSQISSPYK